MDKNPETAGNTEVLTCFESVCGYAFQHIGRGLQQIPEHAENRRLFLRSPEQLGAAAEIGADPSKLILDNGLHIFNSRAYESYCRLYGTGFSFVTSFEQTFREIQQLYEALPEHGKKAMIIPVYGRIPLMVSAGCIKETKFKCDSTSGFLYIKDRKNVEFPVYNDCSECISVIYNSLPLSGHEILYREFCPLASFKLEFTTESGGDVENILDYYLRDQDKPPKRPDFPYTTGHLRKKIL